MLTATHCVCSTGRDAAAAAIASRSRRTCGTRSNSGVGILSNSFVANCESARGNKKSRGRRHGSGWRQGGGVAGGTRFEERGQQLRSDGGETWKWVRRRRNVEVGQTEEKRGSGSDGGETWKWVRRRRNVEVGQTRWIGKGAGSARAIEGRTE
eukprot:6189682-Pleurochrysis_carterae.AAC.1